MKHILSLCMLLCVFTFVNAQHTIKLSVKDKQDSTALVGASVTIISLKQTVISDSSGNVLFTNIPARNYVLKLTYVGMEEQEINISVPQPNETIVWLEASEEEEEEVIVTATRISRSIGDIPTRVETISGEELTEKGNMKPGDIRMLLNESTGIQTQQTSATSYNSSIRIQGLDGRYTQILRDGFPLYAGFSGGLSLMQIAPLDLKQIEVIKGAASTLYGAGAIAGLVNLVSKTPEEKRVLSFMANGTTAGGLDLSGFYSQRFEKTGITVFGSRNTAMPYDPANSGLTAIPKFERYTINPRLFIYGEQTSANIGFSYISEDRTGGSMNYIKNGTPGYFEQNNTDRFTTQAQLTQKLGDNGQLNFKNSYSRFKRFIQVPGYSFNGLQQSTFSEATYTTKADKTDWVIGANLITDKFTEAQQGNNPLRNYTYNTLGVFLQHSWTPSSRFSIETGLRGDQVKQFGFEWMPRVSIMLKPASNLTLRLGGGFGYKTPTLFNEASEQVQYQGILPINENSTVNERSVGTNFDINFRTHIGEVGLAINQLFFYTRLNKPLVLTTNGMGMQEFKNANGYMDTKGMETNLRFTYSDLKLFIGYTYADVNTNYNSIKSWFPLTARHRLNNVLMYEKEEKLKIGLEAYFFSPQQLSDGTKGKSYWIFGLMAEKLWERFSLFVNFENISDTRQTKFGPIYTGSINNPVFKDIYAPVDGFVTNGGIKIHL